MATWNPITAQSDIKHLLNVFGGFHDSCLREAHVWTDQYVSTDLSMKCDGNTQIRLLVQRQGKEPSAIELLFEKVTTFHLLPSRENYDSIIFGATMLRDDDVYYWADSAGWSPKLPERDSTTWVGAKKLSWRDASNWMGSQRRYGEQEFHPKIEV